jgi:hypothetical protein
MSRATPPEADKPFQQACTASLSCGRQLRPARRIRAYARVRAHTRIGLGLGSCLLALLLACGGGGGSAEVGTDGSSAVLNAGVSGRLYTQFAGNYLETDLASGRTRIIRSDSVLRGPFSPVGNTEEFVSTSRTVDGETIDGNNNEAILFFGRQGVTTRGFVIASGFSGVPLTSPNGSRILVEWHDTEQEDAIPVPTVFTTSGEIVARYPNYNNQYAWLPNGDVLLGRGQVIYQANPDSTLEPQAIITIPNGHKDLHASPDGKQVMFTSIADNGNIGAWVVNTDGTGLRELAFASQTMAFAGGFSPDGTQALVAEGFDFTIIAGGGVSSDCPKLHVVPVNTNTAIDLSAASIAPAVKLRHLSPSTGGVVDEICTRLSLAWR